MCFLTWHLYKTFFSFDIKLLRSEAVHVHAHFPLLVWVGQRSAGSARTLAVSGAEALREARAQLARPRRVKAGAQSRSCPAGPVHR